MPELPEVEVLVRHLQPLLLGQRISAVKVCRAKIISPHSIHHFSSVLAGARFVQVSRRGKYLVFALRQPKSAQVLPMIGHLGMTGRMYLLPAGAELPKHTAAVLGLEKHRFVFEDTRYFGRLSLDAGALSKLGPEPLGADFTPKHLELGLRRSSQPIKVKLLDQSLLAGVGNIYASEALFLAGIPPRRSSRKLSNAEIRSLWKAVRRVLRKAIRFGSTVPLDWQGTAREDGLFYYGRAPGTPDYYEERLKVYDRKGRPCVRCGCPIQRIVQAARSTYYCPECQS